MTIPSASAKATEAANPDVYQAILARADAELEALTPSSPLPETALIPRGEE